MILIDSRRRIVEKKEEKTSPQLDTQLVAENDILKNVAAKTVRKLFRIFLEDSYDSDNLTTEDFISWIEDLCQDGKVTGAILEYGDQFTAEQMWQEFKDDPKFVEVIVKLCEAIGWINHDGYYLDGDSEPTREKPDAKKLFIEYMRLTPKGKKDISMQYLRDAYFKDRYPEQVKVSTVEEIEENLNQDDTKVNEDVESSMPVQFLPKDQIIEYVKNIPEARAAKYDEEGNKIANAVPPKFFKLGYFKELTPSSKYRGGRKASPEDPVVRIFKATEYSKLYTGADYENLGAVKRYRKETGVARSGERTGFSYSGENDLKNKIGSYANGSDGVLQAYIADDSRQRVKFFISINDGDLQEVTRNEVAKYLSASEAARLLTSDGGPTTKQVITHDDETTDVLFNPQRVNRFKIDKIYMIGSLGKSLM